MRNKIISRFLSVILAVGLSAAMFTTTAFAGGGDEEGEVIPTEPTGEVVSNPAPKPLTPEGNLSLVDDIDGEASEDKQFITVVSKTGNYFYIIIDRAEDGEDTVHFLNQVDEADLLSLMEDGEQAPAVCSCSSKCAAGAVNTSCAACSVNMSECAGKAPEPEPDPETEKPETKKKSGNTGLLVIVLVLALAGGGAVYYLKFMKKKPEAKGSTDLDDYDYGDDEDELEEDTDPDAEEDV